MPLIISFYAGGSGNFIADFLLQTHSARVTHFRIDSENSVANPCQIFLDAGRSQQDSRFVDFTNHELIAKKLEEILLVNPEQIITHYTNVSKLKEIAPQCDIIKIYPTTNIFGLIKNTIVKKREAQFTSYQYVDQLKIKIDHVFISIVDHYYNLTTIEAEDFNYIVDFGQLYNIDFLCSLYKKYNGTEPDDFKIRFAHEYINLQYSAINDTELKDFDAIVSFINPRDYFDVAVCLFIYEKNHNTVNRNRLWSVNDIPNSIDDSLIFLQQNAKNYSIF